MASSPSHPTQIPASSRWHAGWLSWVLIAAIVIGIALRGWHVDLKPLWIDECYTLLHLTGYSDAQIAQVVWQGQPVTAAALLKFQIPTAVNTWGQMVARIAETSPELPPLYFTLLRQWALHLGSSITSLRSFSGLMSVILLPLSYWLCWELFGVARIGWVTVALLAVSPFQLVYAQEMRTYTLWATLIVTATAALVRAIKSGGNWPWLLYGLMGILALYTHLFTIFIGLAHGFAVLLSRLSARLKLKFLLVCAVMAVAFTPWLWACWQVRNHSVHSSLQTDIPMSLINLFKGWLQGIGVQLVDFNLNELSPKWAIALYGVLCLAILGLVAIALLQLRRRTTSAFTHTLLVSLIAIPWGSLMLSDLATHSIRSTFSRYVFPSCMALLIVLAAWIGHGLIQPGATKRWVKGGLVALLSLSLVSDFYWVNTVDWRSKADDRYNPQIAAVLATQAKPVIVSEGFFIRAIALAHVVRPDMVFHLAPAGQMPTLPQGEFFVYHPSDQFTQMLQSRYTLQRLVASNRYDLLLRATPKP